MKILLNAVVLSLIGFPLAVCLTPVPVQCVQTVVLVASGSTATFTVQTVSNPSLIRWIDSSGDTLAIWTNGQATLISVPAFQNRVSVTATQLQISNSQLSDSGNYTVSVEPVSTTGFGVNSCSIQLKVYNAVNGVSLILPALPVEGGNVSLRCGWSAGTAVSVLWAKGGSALTSDSRISVSNDTVFIHPAERSDAGLYSCTVSNPISAQTAQGNLTVYYGPDAPQLSKTSYSCVGGGDASTGQTVRLTCSSSSVPPASYTWQLNGQLLTASQPGSGVLDLQVFSTNQSGNYVCTAQNDITGATSKQQINLVIVGTCLSVGAVAGIVVACVVTIIIIIIIIIVVLRQRNADRRLRDTIELQKNSQNIAVVAPVNGTHSNPPLHYPPQQTQLNSTAEHASNNNYPIRTMAPNSRLHHNGHANGSRQNFSGFPDNGHQNTNSNLNNNPQNSRSFPQNTPNILIQAGGGGPGAVAHTVHVNLNTLPQHDSLIAPQPQTLHVNLNTFPPEQSQAIPSLVQHADTNHTESEHTGQRRSHAVSGDPAPNVPGDATRSRQSSVPNDSRSISPNETRHSETTSQQSDENNQPRLLNRTGQHQMPWDRLRGTPLYPNHQSDSSDQSESTDGASEVSSGQRHQNFVNRLTNVLRRTEPQTNHRSQNPPRTEPHSVANQNVSTQTPNRPQDQTPRVPADAPPRRSSPTDTHTPVPLTQAALRQHTAQTENPFSSRNQQTRAFLSNPEPPSRPSQDVQQLNKSGQRVPTPPPVLQPDEFRSIPQEPLQQPRRHRPFDMQRAHRSPDVHRKSRVWHTGPHQPGANPLHLHPQHPHLMPPRVQHPHHLPPHVQHPHPHPVILRPMNPMHGPVGHRLATHLPQLNRGRPRP